MLNEVNAKHYEKNGGRKDGQDIHTMVPISIFENSEYSCGKNSIV